jgi:ABC-type dipeptide/oligopeptide/nickel transport system permease component
LKNLLRYALTRILLTVPMLWVLLTLVFVVLRIMPGDPVSAMIGGHAPERVIEEQKEKLGCPADPGAILTTRRRLPGPGSPRSATRR